MLKNENYRIKSNKQGFISPEKENKKKQNLKIEKFLQYAIFYYFYIF